MFFHGLEYFSKGGFMMYPLLVCSLAVAIISAERFMYYQANDKGHHYGEKIRDMVMKGDIEALKSISGEGVMADIEKYGVQPTYILPNVREVLRQMEQELN